jgi:hypothetical protein
MRRIIMATRDELMAAVSARYASGTRMERVRVLDEFTAVTGHHLKHATRLLRAGLTSHPRGPLPERRIYDEAVRQALCVIWEASDRICGKRLRPLIPILVEAMERQDHLCLAPEVRTGLLAMSAATTDRVLREAREHAGQRSRRRAPSSISRHWTNCRPIQTLRLRMGSEGGAKATPVVLYDACLLYPFHLRNVLVQLGVNHIVAPC